eukprot:CAMPEP_0203950598 /NCGR_PEP_ID=MMETSP0359-20131031/84688_1 /ASSEMBLY_ACC=CAM_ASM_000338 /TAXON_ID=268821 /ORGANISM="Scrippsiella Hangoei, Strain SHTV-5" /LENGTH=83 /DNA_ID=CAMNT_0050882873 /DNA_START=34 /DNA_END=282 /DNA_ORIENTATION=+
MRGGQDGHLTRALAAEFRACDRQHFAAKIVRPFTPRAACPEENSRSLDILTKSQAEAWPRNVFSRAAWRLGCRDPDNMKVRGC